MCIYICIFIYMYLSDCMYTSLCPSLDSDFCMPRPISSSRPWETEARRNRETCRGLAVSIALGWGGPSQHAPRSVLLRLAPEFPSTQQDVGSCAAQLSFKFAVRPETHSQSSGFDMQLYCIYAHTCCVCLYIYVCE